jgi:hypothetical protein
LARWPTSKTDHWRKTEMMFMVHCDAPGVEPHASFSGMEGHQHLDGRLTNALSVTADLTQCAPLLIPAHPRRLHPAANHGMGPRDAGAIDQCGRSNALGRIPASFWTTAGHQAELDDDLTARIMQRAKRVSRVTTNSSSTCWTCAHASS